MFPMRSIHNLFFVSEGVETKKTEPFLLWSPTFIRGFPRNFKRPSVLFFRQLSPVHEGEQVAVGLPPVEPPRAPIPRHGCAFVTPVTG